MPLATVTNEGKQVLEISLREGCSIDILFEYGNNRERCTCEYEDQVCHDLDCDYEQKKHNQRLCGGGGGENGEGTFARKQHL